MNEDLILIAIDLAIFLLGFTLFAIIRRVNFSFSDELIKEESHPLWNRFVRHTFKRILEHREEKRNWVWNTIRSTDKKVIDNCGCDSYIYLYFLRCLMIVLLISSVSFCPLLYFLDNTTTRLISMIGITILIYGAIFITQIINIRYRSYDNTNLTIKITGLGKSINKEILEEYFTRKYPSTISSIIIYRNGIYQLEDKLSKIRRKMSMYENNSVKNIRRCCRNYNVIDYYKKKEAKLSKEITKLNKKSKNDKKIAYVTFNNKDAAFDFMKISKWKTKITADVDNLEWDNLSINKISRFIRIAVINIITLSTLFFFTTPISFAMIYQSSNIPVLSNDWVSSILTPLLILGLAFIIPQFLFLITKYGGYHRKSIINMIGLYKVYIYQLLAILILPALSIASLDLLFSRSVDFNLVFENGNFFVIYVIQAALITNICDLWRGYELLYEFFYKSRSSSYIEFTSIEKSTPFTFGFSYCYFLLIFTITVYYSTVTPLILPCGLLYFILKYFVDKYNFLYHYMRSNNDNLFVHQTAMICTLLGLTIYHAMTYFNTDSLTVKITSICLSVFSAFVIGIILIIGVIIKIGKLLKPHDSDNRSYGTFQP